MKITVTLSPDEIGGRVIGDIWSLADHLAGDLDDQGWSLDQLQINGADGTVYFTDTRGD